MRPVVGEDEGGGTPQREESAEPETGAASWATKDAWEQASQKHVREYDALLQQAREARLLPVEEELLAEVLRGSPRVLHPQSGHGVDDVALVRAGAREVLGLDYSATAVAAAQRRADDLGAPCRYVVAEIPPLPVADADHDLLYTGKGALIWLPDLDTWADEVVRVLRPGGHLFVHEAHPMVPLWAWDEDEARIRGDRSYFAGRHVNDTFPALGAVEHQHTLASIVMAVIHAGLDLLEMVEHSAPFWAPADVHAKAWDGQLPNSFSLLARRP